MEHSKHIIVIGASAGGMPAIKQLIAGVPHQADAIVFVVLHLSRNSNGHLIIQSFQKHTSLTCQVAVDGLAMNKGYLYLAPPDHHLMIKDGFMHVHQGPHENKYRPSIDVLFRSAAVGYGHSVIGIILTGLLDDGTSGMYAIKKSGGICIVQDPNDAEYGDMPQSVLNVVEVDFEASLLAIPAILMKLMAAPLPPKVPIPTELKIEAAITEKMMSDINDLKKIADHSDFVCPDCGGGLWAIKNDPTHRYRCHTGHVFTENVLHDQQSAHLEESIWVSIRLLEERRNLLLLMAKHAEEKGNHDLLASNVQRADETTKHIERLKKTLAILMEGLKRQDN
jgi:two-component system, chemotaxis family, protein-glutamate methylesterase/glutaminase